MEGQQSTEVVTAAPELAVAAPSGVPAAPGVPGLVSALGNHTVAAAEGHRPPAAGAPPAPPSTEDATLGRALADTLQQRPVAVARFPSISIPKIPVPGGSQPTTTPSNTPGTAPPSPTTEPAPTTDPAPSQGRAGGMLGGVGEMIKKMLEQQAKSRADLEAEIPELEAAVTALSSQIIPGLAAGVQAASSHMAPGMLSANVRALALPITAAKVSPDSEATKNALMDQLRTAVATLESMDEPVAKTVEDTKTSASGGVQSIDAAIAAGQQKDPPPEGGGEAAPRANATQIASLEAAKMQLETVSQLTATTDAASIASLATFTNTTASSLGALGASAHAAMKSDIEAARRKAIGAARQMEAMGRSKDENYQVVAGALGVGMGQAIVMHTSTLIHLDKQKKALAALPKPEPPPEGQP